MGPQELKLLPCQYSDSRVAGFSLFLNLIWRWIMFYPVRILDSKNKLKKIIPVRELKVKHWAEYEKKQEAYASTRIKKTQNIEKMRL